MHVLYIHVLEVHFHQVHARAGSRVGTALSAADQWSGRGGRLTIHDDPYMKNMKNESFFLVDMKY